MKRTGMKRALDRLGRIVLPKEMRDTMDIHIGDPLEFFIEGKELILRRYKSTMCVFCGDPGTEMYFKEQFICQACALELKNPTDIPQQFPPQQEDSPAPEELSVPNTNDTNEEKTVDEERAKAQYPKFNTKTARKLLILKEITEQQPFLSQQQIAEKLGISQGRVSQLKKLL
ncbi:AbrB/MazE/SpoVT family DNA-binding domain-containing protein [Paenibacillus sp. UMB7766-LJ446]|uniref:AbrB/MazE/SpoVT family DNA-binding domain-containing protein n=1 Tax=Paenibacillus sp. UMB7766-LJ446 TaxID=3046313 RepID=UPI0025505EB3|nr:AbrB/MazE/SpoVT family DNA-binding domain-containing protein [Paenibacillus sp. UMB7766-LJ446]MDK8193115.1 AbrB/MazE/SpoVT family DNA-binding domain-containing protein [Paenibacillus sp. UMB7766-LJ446]